MNINADVERKLFFKAADEYGYPMQGSVFDGWLLAKRATLAAQQQSIPFAWYRGIQCGGSPEEPPEWDVDIQYGEDQPIGGNEWAPLYKGAPPPTYQTLSDESLAALKELVAAIDGGGLDRFEAALDAADVLLAKAQS